MALWNVHTSLWNSTFFCERLVGVRIDAGCLSTVGASFGESWIFRYGHNTKLNKVAVFASREHCCDVLVLSRRRRGTQRQLSRTIRAYRSVKGDFP